MKNYTAKRVCLFLLFGIILVLLLSLYYRTKKINDTNVSKPSEKMSFFVTSKNKGAGGNLGGLVGADAYCTAPAEASGVYGKTWVLI